MDKNHVQHILPQVTDIAPCHAQAPTHTTVSVITTSYLFREGLMQLLTAYLRLELISSCGEQRPELAQIPDPASHVVLVDAGLGQTAVIGWITCWRQQVPAAYVLVLELLNDIELILTCVEAGAHGYTLKGASSAEIATAIIEIQQGRSRCSPEVTARLFARLASRASPTAAATCSIPFTQRELEVLHCLACDYSNQEIATELVIEVRTVKHHVHNILAKMQVHHRWDAARVAIERGWVKDVPT